MTQCSVLLRYFPFAKKNSLVRLGTKIGEGTLCELKAIPMKEQNVCLAYLH